MLDTPDTIDETVRELNKLLMPTEEEKKVYENMDFSYLDDDDDDEE